MDIKIIATQDTVLILTSATQVELTRPQAETLYDKLDKYLWSNTRAKLQKQKRDLELKEFEGQDYWD